MSVLEYCKKQLEKYNITLKNLRLFLSLDREFLEKHFRDILIYYHNFMELGLKYLDKNYLLGKSNFRGDILFLDSNNKKLNVEVKVKQEQEIRFKKQMINYLENIDMTKERLMYIAPIITKDQIKFCKENLIEIKKVYLFRVIRKVILKKIEAIKELKITIDCLK